MFTVALSGTLSIALSEPMDSQARDRAGALSKALAERGIVAAPEDIQWIDPPRGVLGALGRSSRALLRASPSAGEPADLFLVETHLSPEGVLIGTGSAYNITETSGADESRPKIKGNLAAYFTRPLVEGASTTVHLVDLAGYAESGAPDWSRMERMQNAVTNYQQTGQMRGIRKRTFAIENKAAESGDSSDEQAGAELAVEIAELGDQRVLVKTVLGEAKLSFDPADPIPAWVRAEDAERSKPPTLVQWAVDRVRSIPWVGDNTMQGIKAVAFTALDWMKRGKESVAGDTGAEDIAADLGTNKLDPPTRAMPVDPEIGWPPPPLVPFVTPVLPGEGEWNPKDKDPFVRTIEGLPPAFLTTFIRSDPSRKGTRVYIALWDPRQVELHMMAGTVEPKSATGEAGPGLIPRDPAVLKRVVAASNAGFQALHGEFGMMADGVVYLPPKPYAATVAVLRDGSTAFGTWPEDATVPDFIRSYRQNMTVMVQDQKFNPYGRTWWGGTVSDSEDKTHTVRTGICQTVENFVAYFYGADLSPESLSRAMIQARCRFGIALDMNAGHSGLEFYKVAPENEFEPMGRPLQLDWEAEGSVPGMDGWKFRGRRLIRGMGLMNFPRYIKREGRDYFYYTLRHVLPGPGIAPVISPPSEGEGQWRVKGLPQHGFPYALALTELRPEASNPNLRVRVLAIDPRTVAAASASASPGARTGKIVAIIGAGEAGAAAAPQADKLSVWHSAGSFSIAAEAPVSGAVRLAAGNKMLDLAGSGFGVRDEDGMLLYVEVFGPAAAAAPDAGAPSAVSTVSGATIDALLKRLGCSTRVLLPSPVALALGGDTNLGGAAVHPPSGPSAVKITRIDAPGVRRIFEDTPVVPFDRWYKLQQHRIRYFKKPKTEASDTAGKDNQ